MLSFTDIHSPEQVHWISLTVIYIYKTCTQSPYILWGHNRPPIPKISGRWDISKVNKDSYRRAAHWFQSADHVISFWPVQITALRNEFKTWMACLADKDATTVLPPCPALCLNSGTNRSLITVYDDLVLLKIAGNLVHALSHRHDTLLQGLCYFSQWQWLDELITCW